MELGDALRIAQHRLRAAEAMRLAQRGVLIGAISAVTYVVAAHFTGAWSSGWLALTPVFAGLLGFLVGWMRGGVSRLDAAIAVDHRLGLRERVSTSTWLAMSEEPSAPDEGSAAHRKYVQGVAAAEVTTIAPARIRAAFGIPMPGRAVLGSCIAVVAALLISSILPSSGEAGVDPGTRLQKEREAQKVREAARKLAKNAAEVSRAAELAKLEEARKLARSMEQQARAMANSPPSKMEALANLSRMSKAMRADLGDQLGMDSEARAFGGETGELQSGELAALSDLARQLDQLDPDGLSLDLDQYRRSLGLELNESREAGRSPELDEAGTRDLMDRLRDMEDVLRQMEQTLKKLESPEYQSLSQETADLLRKIREKLGEMDQYASSCSGGGSPMDHEALREMLEALSEMLDSMSAEEIEKLMKMLSEARLGQSMEQLIGQCKSEIGGSLSEMSDGELSRMLQAIQRLKMAGGGRSPSGGGSKEGQANGGGPGLGEDDGSGMKDERVRGQLDPKGDLGDAVPFRGIPKATDAKLAFDEAVDRAASAAEESLGRDLLPPDAKPFVRRYFEALRESASEKPASGKAGSAGDGK